MKLSTQSKIITAVFLCILGINNANAQFEQKLTINGSGVVIVPDITNDLTSYGTGVGAEGGIQYNINRHFSAISNVRMYYHFGTEEFPDAFFQNIGIGFGLKANLLPTKIVNPYIFAEGNVNMLWEEDWYTYYNSDGTAIGQEFSEESGFSIGGIGGAGIDFRINDNLAIFTQGSVYYIHWVPSVNIVGQVGVRINLIKSKTL